jgi:hypothetical protein
MVQILKSQSSILTLYRKYTRALTFENLFQLHMQPQAQQKKQLWYMTHSQKSSCSSSI